MRLIRQLRYIFPKKQRMLYLLLFVLQLIGTALDFAGVSLIYPFVQILVNMQSLQGTWWYRLILNLLHTDSSKAVMLFLTLLLMVVYLVKNLYTFLMIELSVRFISANKVRMGAKMISCYMNKPYTFHLQRNTAEIIRNINQDVNGAFSVIGTMFGLVSDVMVVAALVAYLMVIDAGLTAALSAALLFCSVLYFLVVRKKISDAGKQSRVYGMKMIKAIHQSMGGIKEVKVMGREKFFADVYESAGAQSVALGRRYSIIAAVPGRMIEVLCIISVLGVIAYRIITGEDLSALLPSLAAFGLAAIRLMPRANSINGSINSITFNRPSLDALYDDLKTSEEEEEARRREIAAKKREHRTVPKGAERDILVKNVTYTYPEREKPVLQNVSLQIRHGTSVGIVGVTGAGKTTLVDVILGLLKPDSGSVCYGTLDIHEDYAEWQKHIGYIPQNIYLVDDTIRNNVALGVEEENIDDAQVWKALENAQLAEFVRSLDEGLDTVIGERGVRISGGQRQRVGIARALYDNPEILFFDEATSALDSETEAAVMQSIHALGRDKTMIIVAHRLTTIADCDKIFRVENNRVEETTL